MARPSKNLVRTPRQERSRATVSAILEAAAQILRSDGLEDTTTSKIAKRAGVSVGSLYQYFKDKDAIFGALVDAHLVKLAEVRSQQYADLTDGPVDEVIPAFVDALLEIHKTDPQLRWQLHRWELSQGLARLEAFRESNIDTVAALLSAFQHRLRPIDDPILTARIAIISFGGVVEMMTREHPARMADPAVRRELSAMLVGFLAPHNPVFSSVA